MDLPCPVHGGRRAYRGCFHCRKPICRLCELKMRGHVYCSPRCAREDGRLAFWRPIFERLARPVPPRLALAAVGLGVIAPMLLALRTVGELDRLSQQPWSPSLRRPPAARIEAVALDTAGARIEGSASPGGAVFLFGPGGFLRSAPVESGRFRFDGVRDTGPFRVGILPLSPEASPPAPVATAPAREPEPAVSRSATAPVREASPSPPRALPREIPTPVRLAALPREIPTPVRIPPLSPRMPASSPREAPSDFVPDFTRGPTDRPELVVSFDAGSSDRGARQILDALRERGIRTTLFVTGEFVRRNPEVARRIAQDGHEVGNHTDTHPHLTTYGQDGRQTTRPGVDRAFV
ncbi:MAG TPA: polysaccharide deacetylase family protein, partial [Thermoanaerobaculia bacterium]|nr:polysaccharide deacetylase family protein [Thermoanaerobaculia bacterium]